jgi:vacuolar-type H+-ATPase subunit E/Vma4
MKPLGSVAAVVAAIHEDASAEVDAITRQMDADIARLRAEDAARLVTFAEGDLQIAGARDRARARLAQEDWFDSRAAIDERELWLARVVDLGRRRLDVSVTPEQRKRQLARLAQESIERMHAVEVDIVVTHADAAILDERWRDALISATGLESIAVVGGDIGGGCLVRSRDGRMSFDNTYPSRADRFRNVWRAALAELYERAVQPLTAPPSAAPWRS